jgi:hypothetical protein
MNGQHANGSSASASGASSPIRPYDARAITFPGPTPQSEDYDKLRRSIGGNLALVIDNGILLCLFPAYLLGSSQLRAGWAHENEPRLAIENLVARYRERKAARTYCLVGNDALADTTTRSVAKSPYEGPVVSNWDLMVFRLCFMELTTGNCARLYICETWIIRGLISASYCHDRTYLQSKLQ